MCFCVGRWEHDKLRALSWSLKLGLLYHRGAAAALLQLEALRPCQLSCTTVQSGPCSCDSAGRSGVAVLLPSVLRDARCPHEQSVGRARAPRAAPALGSQLSVQGHGWDPWADRQPTATRAYRWLCHFLWLGKDRGTGGLSLYMRKCFIPVNFCHHWEWPPSGWTGWSLRCFQP